MNLIPSTFLQLIALNMGECAKKECQVIFQIRLDKCGYLEILHVPSQNIVAMVESTRIVSTAQWYLAGSLPALLLSLT